MLTNRMLTNRIWRQAFWAAAAAVLALSLAPTGAELPSTGWDKSNHFVGFVALAVLGLKGYRGHGARLFAGLLLFGGLIEWLQSLTGYRLGEWGDWIADGVGALAGFGLHRLLAAVRSGAR